MLQLLSARSEDHLLPLWEQIWQDTPHYDHLPVSCRLLLPAVVRRLQQSSVSEKWKLVHGLDLTFLGGLPRYFWAKNQYLLNQTRLIGDRLHSRGIRIVALKGMAELIEGSPTAMMRSTLDLDILVRPEDLEVFREITRELGYKEIDFREGRWLNLPVPKDQHWFKATDVRQADIDAHVLVDKFRFGNRLTEKVWSGARQSSLSKGIDVPASRERFWISIANAFRVGNWAEGNTLKYLHDAFVAWSSLDAQEARQVLQLGKKHALLRDWQEQILELGISLGIFDKQVLARTYEALAGYQNSENQERGSKKVKPGFLRVNARTAYFLQSRLDAFLLTLGTLRRQGVTLEGLLFVLIAPFRSLWNAWRHRQKSKPQVLNPASGTPIPPPPPVFLKWGW